MTRRDRFRHWLAEKILAGHAPDCGCYDSEPCWCEDTRPYPEPDYYTEDGNAVYDISKRLFAMSEETKGAFALMMEHVMQRDRKKIEWLEDDLTPPDRPAREPRTEPEAPSTDHR